MTSPTVLGERYEIGGVLGRGGMAEVHRGRDLRLGREVAVKVLRSDLARDPSFQVRFRREAQAAASLNHPSIVAVYDTGEDRTANGATPFIVMEYVEGETLRDVLRREGRLDAEQAMTYAADICAALDFSHRNGIVHRDVKPGNVMVTPQGTVKVMDFGIARAVSDSAATMTSTAAVIGTAQYLSPEQARGDSVDARSDVYSLGCLLYELVTGAPPFTGDSPVSVAYQHVREDPRLPSSINPAIPPELDAILLKAMSKNPANRYQSAAEMRNDLLRALAGQRVEATPVMGENERTQILGVPPPGLGGYGGYGGRYDDPGDRRPPEPYAGRGDRWDEDDERDRRRRRNRIVALVTAALVLLGGAIALAVVLTRDTTPAAPTITRVTVPDLVAKARDDAVRELEAAGLRVGTEATQASSAQLKGQVLSTTPAAGAKADKGSAVNLVVGAGPNTLAVPNDLVGLTASQAQALIKQAGFTGDINTNQTDSLEQTGRVVAVQPRPGTQAAKEVTFTLSVSTGTVKMPNVVNQTRDAAVKALTDLKVPSSNVDVTDVERDDVPQGTVVASNPPAGAPVSSTTRIQLQVAVPTPPQPSPKTVAVPSVAGQDEKTARQTLSDAGFTNIRREDAPAATGDTPGTAKNTRPPAGSQADPTKEIVLPIVTG